MRQICSRFSRTVSKDSNGRAFYMAVVSRKCSLTPRRSSFPYGCFNSGVIESACHHSLVMTCILLDCLPCVQVPQPGGAIRGRG